MKNYLRLGGLFKLKYLFVDTENYDADSVFYRNKITVWFGEEFIKEHEPYRLISCKIKRKDKERFEKALGEVEVKMNLLGHTDYGDWCDAFMSAFEERLERGLSDARRA